MNLQYLTVDNQIYISDNQITHSELNVVFTIVVLSNQILFYTIS